MNILIASSICKDAVQQLRAHHDVICAFDADQETLSSLVQDRDVIVFRSGVQINAEVMRRAPNLRLLIRAGSGLDNLDLEYVRRREITLFRIPEPGAQAVAELAFGLMLALSRQIFEAHQQLREGHWTKQVRTGYLLHDKVLGIIGAGNIGSRVGLMGAAWGMKPIGCVENPSPDAARSLEAKGIRLGSFDQVLAESDYLSIHCPLKDSTRGIIDDGALSLCKPTAFLINMARGGVVDEQALYRALNGKHGLAGAALDVHESEGEGKVSPLAALPNVILTPHIGATTVDTQREIGRRIIEFITSRQSNGKSRNHDGDNGLPGSGVSKHQQPIAEVI